MTNRIKFLEYGSFLFFVAGALTFLLHDNGTTYGTALLVVAILMRTMYVRSSRKKSKPTEGVIDEMDHED